MPTVREVVETLDNLLAEISALDQTRIETALKDEKVEHWTRRVHVTLSNWGRGGDANRFSGTHYNPMGLRGYESFDLKKKIEARTMALKALRDDIAEHADFWETQFAPRPAAQIQAVQVAKPDKVFLGHGGNPLWSKVHIHLKDELHLNVHAWESESRASRYPLDVLKELLDSCTFAVLVQTGEDATSDGVLRARQNVIHEIGLFQGRLGFERVALLEQEGIESFSNIHGLQLIRFPGNKIESAYYELDRMLVREQLIQQARPA